MRASIKAIPAVLVLALAARPAPASAKADLFEYPGQSRGGFGFHGFIVPLERGTFDASGPGGSESWKGKFSGGLGLFGDFFPLPWLSVGLGANLAFPEVSRKDGEKCGECRLDYSVNVLARVKFVIQMTRAASFYPIILFGYSHRHHTEADRDVGHDGMGFGGGLGVEIYTAPTAIGFEVRYSGHHSPDGAGGGTGGALTDHGLAVLMFFRLL